MNPERRNKILSQMLNKADTNGTEAQQNAMTYFIALQSQCYNELGDIKEGVKREAAHHPEQSLRDGVVYGWKRVRSLNKEIQENITEPRETVVFDSSEHNPV